jgi:hypothetical protein
LFYASCGNRWRDPRPDRPKVPTTDATRRFVAGLKQRYRGDRPWGGGNFRAAEGFVIVPVESRRFADVWAAAVELGREHGVAVFDPECNRLVRPAARRRVATQA